MAYDNEDLWTILKINHLGRVFAIAGTARSRASARQWIKEAKGRKKTDTRYRVVKNRWIT